MGCSTGLDSFWLGVGVDSGFLLVAVVGGCLGLFIVGGGSLAGSTLKSSGLISGGKGRSDKSPTGGKVISVTGGREERSKLGGGGITKGGKVLESPIPGIRLPGIAKGAAGSLVSTGGKLAISGTFGVSN